MSSLLALLSQNQPNLQTRKGLILLGLQNDFLSPDGKLPVSPRSGYLERLKQLVPGFREHGDVIWVRSEFEANRPTSTSDDMGDSVIAGSTAKELPDSRSGPKRKASQDVSHPSKRSKPADSDDDPELFLTRTSTREPCCLKGSWGAEYPKGIQSLMDEKDVQVTKTYYSGFGSTSLLLTLRSRLITELYVCGCNTNLSVFATAMDAARYGIHIILIEDCLGYRRLERHEDAIRQLVEIMGAHVVSSDKVIDRLRNPPKDEYGEEDEETSEEEGQLSAVDELSAGGDEDEEEEFNPHVRTHTAQVSRELALRFSSSAERSRRDIAMEADRSPTAQRRESPSTQHSSTHDEYDTGSNEPSCRPSFSSRSRQQQNDVQSKVSKHADESSIEAMSAFGAGAKSCDSSESSSSKAAPTRLDHPFSDVATCATRKGLSPGDSFGLAVSPSSGMGREDSLREQEDTKGKACTNDFDLGACQSAPLLGHDNENESGGSRILYEMLPTELAETVFERLHREMDWQRMFHQTGEVPRLVCCQGDISEDGSMPVYRHPSDQTLPLYAWTPTVDAVRMAAQKAVGHPLNHALIQLYRGGTDYISEHSDKTLDVAKGSNIVNVSFGAQRTMRLRTKREAASSSSSANPPGRAARTTYRIPMPHNSALIMSLETNAKYLHGINADKRPDLEFSAAEKAYDRQRISLTLRHIATFLDADSKFIWGQGAQGKFKDAARPVVNGDASESEKLVRAFGAENQASSIDWETVYGGGFDVLHLK